MAIKTVNMRFITAALLGAASAAAQEFIFTGTNEAGGEFGESVLPGELGTHYIWPDASTIDVRATIEAASAVD